MRVYVCARCGLPDDEPPCACFAPSLSLSLFPSELSYYTSKHGRGRHTGKKKTTSRAVCVYANFMASFRHLFRRAFRPIHVRRYPLPWPDIVPPAKVSEITFCPPGWLAVNNQYFSQIRSSECFFFTFQQPCAMCMCVRVCFCVCVCVCVCVSVCVWYTPERQETFFSAGQSWNPVNAPAWTCDWKTWCSKVLYRAQRFLYIYFDTLPTFQMAKVGRSVCIVFRPESISCKFLWPGCSVHSSIYNQIPPGLILGQRTKRSRASCGQACLHWLGDELYDGVVALLLGLGQPGVYVLLPLRHGGVEQASARRMWTNPLVPRVQKITNLPIGFNWLLMAKFCKWNNIFWHPLTQCNGFKKVRVSSILVTFVC